MLPLYNTSERQTKLRREKLVMTYFIIGGAILGFLLAGSGNRIGGFVVGAFAGAAVRQWIFMKFWK